VLSDPLTMLVGMDATTAEARLLETAGGHHGIFTYEQARAAGLSDGAIQGRFDTGRWQRLHRCVYRAAGQPSTFEQRLLAAVWFNGRGSVASHRAAARLWDLPGYATAPVEVTKPRGRSQRKEYGWLHGSLHLPPEHCTEREGIPVTAPARLAFDLAASQHPRKAERSLDTLLARGLVTVGQLEVVVAGHARRGRPGSTLMRELLDVRGVGYIAPNSELEALGRSVLRDWGVPDPHVEKDLGDAREWVGRVDLVYAADRLVIELDSRRHHTALLDRTSDRQRDNRFMADGWRVLRYTWWDLVERPGEVVAEIKQALRARSAA